MPVAQNGGVRGQHLADGAHRLFRPAFLDKADGRIGNHNRDDDGGVDEVSEPRGDEGRTEKHIDQHIVKMSQEPKEGTAFRGVGETIGAKLPQTKLLLGSDHLA